MLPSHWFARRFRLQIKHVLPKIIQLRFIELCWQDRVHRILQVLQRRAHARNDRIRFHPHCHHLLQCWEVAFQLCDNRFVVKEISILVPRLLKYFLKQVGYVVRTDDATIPPDLDHFRKVDAPSVLLVCLINNVDALDEGCEERGIDCFAKIL